MTTYTAEQMRQYARTYAADLERRLQEAGEFAAVAVRECPPDQPMVTDWMDCAMKACRALAATSAAAAAGKE